jgi:hypothetical protein
MSEVEKLQRPLDDQISRMRREDQKLTLQFAHAVSEAYGSEDLKPVMAYEERLYGRLYRILNELGKSRDRRDEPGDK